MVESFNKKIVNLHGLPQTIVSDRDTVFANQFRQHLFKLNGGGLVTNSGGVVHENSLLEIKPHVTAKSYNEQRRKNMHTRLG